MQNYGEIEMKILHYALGFPPYRSGGLTKLCIDLMVQQSKEGHIIGMLWPGKMGFINKRTTIQNHKMVVLEKQNLYNFELINPLPIPFDEGIVDISSFISDLNQKPYDILLDNFKPDVIHIHTLMGISKSFLIAAKNRNIRLVFSAHDFFPICSKVTMFRAGTICNSAQTCENCGVCNTTALSINKIKILQSRLYRNMKEIFVIKKLRKHHRDNYLKEVAIEKFSEPVRIAADYKKLRNYYYSLLKLMDIIHYNSNITKKIYEDFFYLPNSIVINLTHSDIEDHRSIKTFSDNLLRIRYLGPMGEGKGFYILKSALDKLWKKQHNFCLDIHFVPTEAAPYMKVHERYTYQDLKKIFDETDVLVAPSIWYETFGYTVLESLSYGVPVIISDTVGAQDILVEGGGIVVEDITSEKLFIELQKLTSKTLKEMNKMIFEKQKVIKIEDMSEQIKKSCYE